MRILSVLTSVAAMTSLTAGESLRFPLRSRTPTPDGVHVRVTAASWNPAQTAFIVCDFWDSHHCANAVKRVNEMAPRMAEVVEAARARGVFIIHAPSDCMKNYADHPARKRAQAAPPVRLPEGITQWRHWLNDEEKRAGYPIDASDGGSDDTPAEVTAWKQELAAQGRASQQWPWRGEHPSVRIDAETDIISDKGDEIWYAMAERGITNVIFAGVHTNMCVCGRPFGLRQLTANGKNVVLVRDLTDTMYNPAKPPQVTHYRGTELMLGHVERFLCPTALSSEIFGGRTQTFAADSRPHVAIMIGEDEYKTWETLPAFAEAELGRDFRISYILETAPKASEFAGVEALATAKVLLVSVRRRPLPPAQMEPLRAFVARGGGIVGIRTASHAFAPRKDTETPANRVAWPEWDEKVLGGNYRSHSGAGSKTFAKSTGVAHPILAGLGADEFPTGGSLYHNSPLRGGGPVLLTGRVEGSETSEPVAWTYTSPGQGRVFYTSLGHVEDFKSPAFRTVLANAVRWAAGD